MEPNQTNPSPATSGIPQGIPTGVFPTDQTPAVQSPAPVAPVAPDSAVHKQGPLDRGFHSFIKLMAKITGQPDPITGVQNSASKVFEKGENIIGKVRDVANQVVDKAEDVASQTVNTATNVATKAVNTATNVATQAANTVSNVTTQAVQQVKQVVPPVAQTPTSDPQTPVQSTPEQPK